MLIVGGLLVVGVLALLGAILLIRGEGKPEASKKPAEVAPPATESSSNNALPAPAQQQPSANGVAAKPEQSLTRLLESESESAMRGQVQELSSQLRSLHIQAHALEQHLGKLSATIEEVSALQEPDERPTLVGMPAIQRGARPFKD